MKEYIRRLNEQEKKRKEEQEKKKKKEQERKISKEENMIKRLESEKEISKNEEKRREEDIRKKEEQSRNNKINKEDENIKKEENKVLIFLQKIEEEKKRKEIEQKKKLQEQAENKRKEISAKFIIFQQKREEEENLKNEEKKKILDQKEQKRKEEQEKRYKDYQKKLKDLEEQKILKEEEIKQKLEEEEKMKKEFEIKKFNDYQKNKEEQERKRQEEKKILIEKRNNQLIELLNRQKKLRNENIEINDNNDVIDDNNNNSNNNNSKDIQQEKQNNKLKHTLEDMCIIGNIIKNQIIEEKEINKEKFISIQEATQQCKTPYPSQDDEAMLCLGILAQNLENNGILTAIERKDDDHKDENKQEESSTSLQFLVNGLINKSKYVFIFDFGEERNNELLNNIIEQEKFNNKLKKKLSIEYNIPEDKIIITCPEKGSYKIQVIFLSEEFEAPNPEQFRNSCENEKDFKELCYLKEIQKKVIIEGVKLNQNMLDYRGNQTPDGYGIGQKRGTYDYIPPLGWKGFGLKVLDKYDNGNNDWIKMDGNPNEWAIAYHGIGKSYNNNTEDITNKIYHGGFKGGTGQSMKDYIDINHPPIDINHPPNKVGEGVYCTPDIAEAEKYAGNSSTIINGKRYRMIFMLRVKPDRIRTCKEAPKEWILDGTPNEMRPYRILLKEN